MKEGRKASTEPKPLATMRPEEGIITVVDGLKPRRGRSASKDLSAEKKTKSSVEDGVKTCDIERPVVKKKVVVEGTETRGGVKKRKRGETEIEKAIVLWKPSLEEEMVAKKSVRRPKKRRRKVNKREEAEDVCFVCYDGGDLVVCDLGRCPKAYHLDCIGKNDEFLKAHSGHRGSKLYWKCGVPEMFATAYRALRTNQADRIGKSLGWHECNNCKMAAQHMCYTCTYSLCKGCIEGEKFFFVKGIKNKGFCETCMKIIMQIENIQQAQVDFNDRSSFEYLFKDYWIDLKGNLLLTSDDLAQVRNSMKESTAFVSKEESADELHDCNGDQASISESSFASKHVEGNNPKTRKTKIPSNFLTKDDDSSSETWTSDGDTVDGTKWASKELLEFIAYMKNGDTSLLCEFEVQALLLEYIKRHNLRDPCQKSFITCDSRLEKLFGKVDVKHFEMLKLLESHFVGKMAYQSYQTDDIQGGNAANKLIRLNYEGNHESLTRAADDTQREICLDKKVNQLDSERNHKPQTKASTDESSKSKASTDRSCKSKASTDRNSKSHRKTKELNLLGFKGNCKSLTKLGKDRSSKSLEKCGEVSQLDTEGNSKSLTKAGEDGRSDACEKGPELLQLGSNGNYTPLKKACTDRISKINKEGKDNKIRSTVNEYAAVDVHNINLLYLPHNMVESLLEDMDEFHEKVVGSFVRARISSSGEKPDTYNLVQVVGTGKAAQQYEIGNRTTNMMLKILNSSETEAISIDRISNEKFSEDECKRLRQSIKHSLIRWMTVGEVREIAMSLQAVRAKDRLKREELENKRHIDRLSEKGRRKELKEYLKKMTDLRTTAERLRQEIPEVHVHADPDMGPTHLTDKDVAESDDKRQEIREDCTRLRDAGLNCNGRETTSPGKGSSSSNDTRSRVEPSGSMSRQVSLDKGDSATSAVIELNESSPNQGKDQHHSNTLDGSGNQVVAFGLDTGAWNAQAVVRSGSSSEPAPAPAYFSGKVEIIDVEKMWHYRDPSRKIQGPFSMAQLHKWSTSHFPANLRIWRAAENEEESILLTDALNGNFHKRLPEQEHSFSQPQDATASSHSTRKNNLDIDCEGGDYDSSPLRDKKPSASSWNSSQKNANCLTNDNIQSSNSDKCSSALSGQAALTSDIKEIPSVRSSGQSSVGDSISHQANMFLGCANLTTVGTTNGHDTSTIPVSEQLIVSSTPLLDLEKPAEAQKSCGTSHTSQLDAPQSVVTHSACKLFTKDELPSFTFVDEGVDAMILDSENSLVPPVLSCPKADPHNGVVSNPGVDEEIPSQSTMTDEPHRVPHVDALDHQNICHGHSPTGVEVGGKTKICDVVANDSVKSRSFVAEHEEPASEGVSVEPGPDSLPARIANMNSSMCASTDKHPEENHEWSFNAAMNPEMDPRPSSETQGWEPAVSQKQDLHAVQNHTPGSWADSTSSIHGSFASHSLMTFGMRSMHNDWSRAPENSNAGSRLPQGNASINLGGGLVQGEVPSWGAMPGGNTENYWETGRNVQSSESMSANCVMGSMQNPRNFYRPAPENLNSGSRATQRNSNMSSWGESAQGNTNSWGAPSQGNTTQGNSNLNSWSDSAQGNTNSWGSPSQGNTTVDHGRMQQTRGNSPWVSVRNTSMRDSQQRTNGNGYNSYHNRYYGNDCSRPSNEHSSFGSGGQGRSFTPQGQQICRYHQREGGCRKGADCRFQHLPPP